MAKNITIYGVNGCGNTTITALLASTLARAKNNILIVLDAGIYASLPLFNLKIDEKRSLGKILNSSIYDLLKTPKATLLEEFQVTNNDYISVLSYKSDESERTYELYSKVISDKLVERLSDIEELDYVIYSCRARVDESNLSLSALANADLVLRVDNPNIKSIMYRDSQKNEIKAYKNNFDDVVILNNIYPGDPVDIYINKLNEKVNFKLENNMDVFNMMRDGMLLSSINNLSKRNQAFNKELKEICNFIENYQIDYTEMEEVEEELLSE